MAKKIIRLTENELTNLIQRIVVETKHSSMDEMDSYEGELEEGLFGPSSEEIEERRMELIRKIDDLLEEYEITDNELQNSVDSVLRQAEDNGFDGEVMIQTARRSGRPILLYKPNPTRFQKSGFYRNVMKPMVGGMRRGHEFGSGE